jgi:hypothetical protein
LRARDEFLPVDTAMIYQAGDSIVMPLAQSQLGGAFIHMRKPPSERDAIMVYSGHDKAAALSLNIGNKIRRLRQSRGFKRMRDDAA